MTIALAALAVLLLLALILERRRHDTDLAAREEAWRDERRELCNRIQRPDLIPRKPRTPLPQPELPDAAAYASVGTLNAAPQDGGDGGS